MCENDAAVDAWIDATRRYIWKKVSRGAHEVDAAEVGKFSTGHLVGTIRELAATVPGVREWLVEHMPGEG